MCEVPNSMNSVEDPGEQDGSNSKFNDVLVAGHHVIVALGKLREAYEENGNNYYCKNILDSEKTIEGQMKAVCEAEKEGY